MDFLDECKLFTERHPYISKGSLFIVPLVSVFFGRVFTWIKEAFATEKKVDDAAKAAFQKPEKPSEPSKLFTAKKMDAPEVKTPWVSARPKKRRAALPQVPAAAVQENLIQVPADGNCLYHSFAIAFGVSDHHEVRRAVAAKQLELVQSIMEYADPGLSEMRLNEINAGINDLRQIIEFTNPSPAERTEIENNIKKLEEEKAALDIYNAMLVSFEHEKDSKLEHLSEEKDSVLASITAGIIGRGGEETIQRIDNEIGRLHNQVFDPAEYARQTATEMVYGKTAEIKTLTLVYPVSIHIHERLPSGQIQLDKNNVYGEGRPIKLLLENAHFQPLIT